ncbi:MAG: S-layer homology domain-containing protein [Maledivibacter sp.]|nr:S-layer homology domain-containing protein [Maledivibacter sp.]
MKKILSLVLVLSLVLGSMSMAFAAAPSFSDVENEDVLKAVKRLNAFGIVDGYDDGSYKPEKNITRAEFSKLLITALGLENAANAASGISHFGDVTGGEWFAGAVNVAAGQGIVKGYADGTYRPNAEVKYSEAVTMIVRALGYKDEFLPGKWPGNFIAKAADAGVTDDVTFQPDGIANRGSVAIMLNNALDAKMVKVSSYNKDIFNADSDGIHYILTDVTLLQDKLDIDKYESIELTGTPKVDNGLDSDQVAFRETDDSKMNGEDEDEFNLPSKFDVEDADMLNVLETRLGESLNVYVDDDEVVFFETADNAYTVKWGTVKKGDIDKEKNEITVTFVDGDDKDYDYEDSGKSEIKIYIDNEEKDEDDVKDDLFGKFVIADNGDVSVADLHDWDDEALIVTESKADEFDYIAAADSHKTFEADDFDKVVVMNTAGEVMNMEDLEKDTVVYINEAELAESGDDVAYVVAVETPAVIETADDFDIDDDDKEQEFKTEESGTYDINDSYGTVSADEDDDIVDFESARDELESITGKDAKVKILFDIVKDIRHISTDVDVSSTNLYGVILGTDDDNFDSDEIQVKILTSTEDKVVYDIDFDSDDFYNFTDKAFYGTAPAAKDFTEANLKDLIEGLIVKYTLNSDGEIDSMVVINQDKEDDDTNASTDEIKGDDELEANEANNVDDSDVIIASGKLKEDIEKDSIEFSSTDFEGGKDGVKDFTVASDVIVFDVTGEDADDMDSIKYENLIGNGENKQILVVANDDEEVELVVVTNEVASDTEYVGYLLETREIDDEHYFEMAVYGEDKIKKYEIDTSTVNENKIAEESMVVYNVKSDDTIKIIGASDKDAGQSLPDTSDFEFVVGQVVDVDGDWLKIDTDADKTYNDKVKLYSDTLVYEEDSDDADVDEYDFVLVAKDGTKARVVKRYDIDFEDYDENGSEEEMFEEDLKENEGTTDISGFVFGEGEKPENSNSEESSAYIVDHTYASGTYKRLKTTDANEKVVYLSFSDFTTFKFGETELPKEAVVAWMIAESSNFVVNVDGKTMIVKDKDTEEAAAKDLLAAQKALDFNEIKDSNTKATEVKANLSLPADASGFSPAIAGIAFAWESSDNTAVNKTNGNVTRPDAGKADVNVTLTAKIKKADIELTKDIEVKVLAKDFSAEAGSLSTRAVDITLTLDGYANGDFTVSDFDMDGLGNDSVTFNGVTYTVTYSSGVYTVTATSTTGAAAEAKTVTLSLTEDDKTIEFDLDIQKANAGGENGDFTITVK